MTHDAGPCIGPEPLGPSPGGRVQFQFVLDQDSTPGACLTEGGGRDRESLRETGRERGRGRQRGREGRREGGREREGARGGEMGESEVEGGRERREVEGEGDIGMVKPKALHWH